MSQQRKQLSQQKQQMSQQRQQVAGESESGLGLHHTGQISFDHSDLQFRVQDRTSCLVHPVFSLPRPVSFSSLVINLDVLKILILLCLILLFSASFVSGVPGIEDVSWHHGTTWRLLLSSLVHGVLCFVWQFVKGDHSKQHSYTVIKLAFIMT